MNSCLAQLLSSRPPLRRQHSYPAVNILSCLILLVSLALPGCKQPQPVPAGRLIQPSGRFSFTTPDGWARRKLPGIDFIIVSAGSDHGINSNIFVDFVMPGMSLSNAVCELTSRYARDSSEYRLLSRTRFPTTSGLRGTKIVATRKRHDDLLLATFHYVFRDPARAIAITCTCSDTVKQDYEPVFDAAMETLQSPVD